MTVNLINLLAPDYCYNCRIAGDILCANCVNDITSEPFGQCVQCLQPTSSSQLCRQCRGLFDDAWVVGRRQDALEGLVGESKFAANRRGCDLQAQLLDAIMPTLPADTVVVPIPTIAPHIRERGFGHSERIARQLARQRGLVYQPVLRRATTDVQHGASRQVRLRQAKTAFGVWDKAIPERVVLVDDVYTTGATLQAAARLLRKNGAKTVWIAVTTRQMLD